MWHCGSVFLFFSLFLVFSYFLIIVKYIDIVVVIPIMFIFNLLNEECCSLGILFSGMVTFAYVEHTKIKNTLASCLRCVPPFTQNEARHAAPWRYYVLDQRSIAAPYRRLRRDGVIAGATRRYCDARLCVPSHPLEGGVPCTRLSLSMVCYHSNTYLCAPLYLPKRGVQRTRPTPCSLYPEVISVSQYCGLEPHFSKGVTYCI